MKNVDDLIESAAELADHGRSKGEIADELNVSRETASWLVERGTGDAPAPDPDPSGGPHDVHVDWSTVGHDGSRIGRVGVVMADVLTAGGRSADLTVGIENAGSPLATAVARELDTAFATYTPAKHQWEEGDVGDLEGSFSRNFAGVESSDCFLVDDTVTSGTTMTEAVEAVERAGGTPVACVVLVDKRGLDEVAGVPVHSLLQVIRVGSDE